MTLRLFTARFFSKRTAILGPILCGSVVLSAGHGSVCAKKSGTNRASAKTALFAGQRALDGSDVAAAIEAVNEISKSKSAEATGVLLDALAMGLHPRVATAVLNVLAEGAKPESFEVVAFAMHHRNSSVRIAALKAMGALAVADKRATALVVGMLSDGNHSVRAAAAAYLANEKVAAAVLPLMKLLKKGDKASASALALLATPKTVDALADYIGKAPDELLSRCLGAILLRADFKPEDARVSVVKILGKIPGNESLEQLTSYIGSLPETPPRESRKEAESIVEARLGGA